MEENVSELEETLQKEKPKHGSFPYLLQTISYPISLPYPLLPQNQEYLKKCQEQRNDPSFFLPIPIINRFPRNGNEGLYGWTIRGSGIINQRDDLHLSGDWWRNYVHEAIHTDDEYETKRLTEWIVEGEQQKPYHHQPKYRS